MCLHPMHVFMALHGWDHTKTPLSSRTMGRIIPAPVMGWWVPVVDLTVCCSREIPVCGVVSSSGHQEATQFYKGI